jgi:hypothetical protein
VAAYINQLVESLLLIDIYFCYGSFTTFLNVCPPHLGGFSGKFDDVFDNKWRERFEELLTGVIIRVLK